MFKTVFSATVFSLVITLIFSLPVSADDVTLDNISFSGVGASIAQEFIHTEGEPYKGTAFITVTNTGTESWGDFHFQIVGSNIQNVDFVVNTLHPIVSNKTIDSYVVDNVAVGSTLDLYFYSNPVAPNGTFYVALYTDNTTDKNSFFGLSMYPTPVPEPATLAVLGLGSLALLRKRSR